MKILVLDIETTGLSSVLDKIVELGIVSLNTISGEKEMVFSKVFNPGLTHDELEKTWICQSGYIMPTEILLGESLEDNLSEIQTIIDYFKDGATAFNNTFDFGFLENVGIKFPKKLACPMKVSTDIVQIPSKNRVGFKWPNVDEAYQFFFPGTTYKEIHRGPDDAWHEADIVMALINRGAFFGKETPTIKPSEKDIVLAKSNHLHKNRPEKTTLAKITSLDALPVEGLDLEQSTETKLNYLPYLAQLEEIVQESTQIDFKNPSFEHEKIASDLRKKTVKIRTGAAATKDDRKKIHLLKGNLEQSAYNLVKSECELIEEQLRAVENYTQNRLAKEQQLLIEKRNNIIGEINPTFIGDVAGYSDDEFEKLIEDQKILLAAKKQLAEQEAAKKIEQEKKAKLYSERKEQLIEFWSFLKEDHKSVDFGELPQESFDIILNEVKEEKKKADELAETTRLENERLKAEFKKRHDASELERQRIEKLKSLGCSFDGVNFKAAAIVFSLSSINSQADNEFEAYVTWLKQQIQSEYLARVKFNSDILIEAGFVRHNKDSFKKDNFILPIELIEKHSELELRAEITRIDGLIKQNEANRLAMSSEKERLNHWVKSFNGDVFDRANFSDYSISTASDIIDKFEVFKAWAVKRIETL